MYRCSGTLARAPVAKSESFFGSSLKPSKTRGKNISKPFGTALGDALFIVSSSLFYRSAGRHFLVLAGIVDLTARFRFARGPKRSRFLPSCSLLVAGRPGCRTHWLPDALVAGRTG